MNPLLSGTLLADIRRSVAQATKNRVGLTCVLGAHPPYVIDRQGYAVEFCDVDFEAAWLAGRWWTRTERVGHRATY